MRRRWLFAIFAVPLLVLPAAVYVWLVYPIPRIDEDAFDQIKIGISHRHVEAITKVPPEDYYRGPRGELPLKLILWPLKSKGMSQHAIPKDWCSKNRQPHNGRVVAWYGNEYLIEVAIDEDDNVVGSYLYLVCPTGPPSLLERMRRWLRL